MIVDVRGNVVQAPELFFQKAQTLVDRGWGLGVAPPSDEAVALSARRACEFMDLVGVDLQLIVPRMYHLAHSEQPASAVAAWIAAYNDFIVRQSRVCPERLQPVGAIPLIAGESPRVALDEVERCMSELGCVALALNPDPGEGDGRTPHLGDEYWYPLWERLVALDAPALVLAGACRSTRVSYFAHAINEASNATLALIEHPNVFADFPGLKLVIGYGGGSVPYQAGRWRIRRWRQPHLEDFDTSLRRLWFDTVVHTKESLELLIKVVGSERCLFGTQRPGAGSGRDPESGRWGDDLKPLVDEIDWLTDADRAAIFEGNARALLLRLPAAPTA